MLINPPVQYRKRQAKGKKPAATPTPSAPVLLSASIGDGSGPLVLQFDRPINIGNYDGSTTFVNIGAAQYMTDIEISLLNPTTLQASLDYMGQVPDAGTVLIVDLPTGIIAVDGGIAWGGCDNLGLPYS